MEDQPAVGAYRDPDLEAAKGWGLCAENSQLNAADREWVHDRIRQRVAEREARAEAHKVRLADLGRKTGRAVAQNEMTLKEAEARAEPFLRYLDPEMSVPHLLVPREHAERIVADAFAKGFADGS